MNAGKIRPIFTDMLSLRVILILALAITSIMLVVAAKLLRKRQLTI
jgi:hypothetical protein